MKKKLIFLVVVMFAISSVASAAIITSVDRTLGAVADKDRPPIHDYDGETDPLPMEPGGLANGVGVFSDRTYPYANTPDELLGAEYIRTFNNDKNEADTVKYLVTTAYSSYFAIGIDDRWEDDDGVDTRQDRINAITAAVVPAGTFVDSGLNVYIREKDDGSRDRPLSIFTAELPGGAHTFSGAGTDGNNFMIMGAVIPEPATIALLGFGGLALLRRKRS